MPYNPPKTFITSSGAYTDSKGSGLIGAMPADEKEFDVMGGLWKPDGRSKVSASQDGAGKRYVLNNSSYQQAFPVYGQLPPPNIKPRAQFSQGWAKF